MRRSTQVIAGAFGAGVLALALAAPFAAPAKDSDRRGSVASVARNDGRINVSAAGIPTSITVRVEGNTVVLSAGEGFSAGEGCTIGPGRVECGSVETLDSVVARLRGGDDFFSAILPVVSGQPPKIRVRGGSGKDSIFGGPGNLAINGGPGKDRLGHVCCDFEFGAGNDVLRGGRGRDLLVGGAGRDLLLGGKGRDRMLGLDGRDVLRGGRGARDLANGGPNADWLAGGPGRRDRCFGGTGRDRARPSCERIRDVP